MRDKIIRIRTNGKELAALKDLAVARGLSISDLIRRSALGVRLPPRSFDRTHITLFTQALGELGRVGSNLNQLTRRANAGKLVGYDADLCRTLAEIDALRSRIRDFIA